MLGNCKTLLISSVISLIIQPPLYAKTAAETQAEADLTKATAAYGERKYDQAQTLYANAVKGFEGCGRSCELQLSRALLGLGNSFYSQSKYSQAEPLLKKSLAIQERALPHDSQEFGQTLSALGDTYRAERKYPDSEASYRRALTIKEKQPPDESLGWLYQNLAVCTHENQKVADSEVFYRKALALREKNADINTAWTLYGLGDVCNRNNKAQQAIEYWRKALTLREKFLGTNSPELIGLLIRIGGYCYARKDYTTAEQYFKRAVMIGERTPDTLEKAWAFQSLANLYVLQGRKPDAELAFKRALLIREKLAGPNSDLVLEILEQYSNMIKNDKQKTGELQALEVRIAAIRTHPKD